MHKECAKTDRRSPPNVNSFYTTPRILPERKMARILLLGMLCRCYHDEMAVRPMEKIPAGILNEEIQLSCATGLGQLRSPAGEALFQVGMEEGCENYVVLFPGEKNGNGHPKRLGLVRSHCALDRQTSNRRRLFPVFLDAILVFYFFYPHHLEELRGKDTPSELELCHPYIIS